MPKMKIEFDGFDQVVARINKLEGDVKKTSEKALKASRDYITPNIKKEMSKHKRTGKTASSIAENESVKWEGSKASIYVGFKIKEGGIASIFLMYGTPKMKKDQKLYNAIYGASTLRKIKNIQENIFYDEIRRMGG